MIHLEAGLVLPLMNHLVQEGVHRLVPAMPPNVTATDDDLGRISFLPAPRVMAKPALEPPGHSNRNLVELASKLFSIETIVPIDQLAHIRLIGRMRLVRGPTRPASSPRMLRNSVRQQPASCISACVPRPRLNEVDDR